MFKIDWENGKYILTTPKDFVPQRRIELLLNSRFTKQDNNTFVATFNTYKEYETFENNFNARIKRKNKQIIRTKNIEDYINSRKLYLDERQKLGIAIKTENIIKKNKEYIEFCNYMDGIMRRPLREKQKQAAFHAIQIKRTMNFSVPGSGKTAMIYGAFHYLKKQNICNKLVIIAPLNAEKSWIDEYENCFNQRIDNKYYSFTNNNIYSWHQRISEIIFINFEKINGNSKDLYELIDKKTFLVIDEVHRIKNPEGKRAKAVIQSVKNAGYICSLSGTPMPNKYIDVYNMLNILYQDEYDFFNYSEKDLNNPTEEFKEKFCEDINPFFIRVTKNQLNIPEINKDKLYIIQPNRIEEKIFDIISQKDISYLAKFVFWTQIQSSPKSFITAKEMNKKLIDDNFKKEQNEKVLKDFLNIDFSTEEINLFKSVKQTSKIEKAIDVISNVVSENKTIVVWCNFLNTMDIIEKELISRKIAVAKINGSVDKLTRGLIIEKFNHKKISVLIANPQTLAESVSLHHNCHDALYVELSLNMAQFSQSKDRIHRLGLLEEQYTQYHYILNSTNEFNEAVYKRLQEKEEEMKNVFEKKDYTLFDYNTEEEEIKSLMMKLQKRR